ncbi:MGMT family protein [Brevibacterium salitolerans]|uniref:MGMT family protein n=1 Tax=Brevibacterium salitolerans TaxID=1403566 RepID=A0ABN2WAZ8_9MICO
MDELALERTLRAVECIPAGQVAAYGDVGRAAGTSARFAARVLSLYGSTVTWWRVPNARGEMPPALAVRALPHWREEGTPLVGTDAGTGADRSQPRVDMRSARVDLPAFAASVEAALADLPEEDPDAP